MKPNPAIVIGSKVRSHYRAPWTGQVVSIGVDREGKVIAEECAVVRVTHSRRGSALRKPIHKVISTWWLDPLPTVGNVVHYLLHNSFQYLCGEYRKAIGKHAPGTRDQDKVTCPGCRDELSREEIET